MGTAIWQTHGYGSWDAAQRGSHGACHGGAAAHPAMYTASGFSAPEKEDPRKHVVLKEGVFAGSDVACTRLHYTLRCAGMSVKVL